MGKYKPLLSEQVLAAMQRHTKSLMTVATIRSLMGEQFSSGSITQALHVLRCQGIVQSYPTKPFLYKLEDTNGTSTEA